MCLEAAEMQAVLRGSQGLLSPSSSFWYTDTNVGQWNLGLYPT